MRRFVRPISTEDSVVTDSVEEASSSSHTAPIIIFVAEAVRCMAARADLADGEAVADSENFRGLIFRFLFCAAIILCRVDSPQEAVSAVDMETFLVTLPVVGGFGDCFDDFKADSDSITGVDDDDGE